MQRLKRDRHPRLTCLIRAGAATPSSEPRACAQPSLLAASAQANRFRTESARRRHGQSGCDLAVAPRWLDGLARATAAPSLPWPVCRRACRARSVRSAYTVLDPDSGKTQTKHLNSELAAGCGVTRIEQGRVAIRATPARNMAPRCGCSVMPPKPTSPGYPPRSPH